MRAFFTSRDPLQWVIVAAIVALIVGAVLPPLVQDRARPLPTDVEISVTSETSQARILDAVNYLTGRPPADTSLPGCDTMPAPLRCYQTQPSAHLERISTTSPNAVDSLANFDSIAHVVVNDKVVAEVSEHSLLNRESTFPAPGPTNSQTVVVADLATGVTADKFTREGLRFFFPSGTEQRSYPYYDPMTSRADPIDFVGTEKIGDVSAYVFHNAFAGIDLVDSINVTLNRGFDDANPQLQQTPGSLRITGTADSLYSPAELEEFGYAPDEQVTIFPWYAVDRTIWVEPTTGIVLNLEENFYTYFAANKEEANVMAQRPWSTERTLFAGDFTWDEPSRAAVLEQAESTVAIDNAMDVVGWFGKALAVALLATAGIMMVRRRDAATDGLTAEDAADAAEVPAAGAP